MKIPIESSKKKYEYSVYVYGALDVRLFLNKCLNVDLKNIEIWVSHGLNVKYFFSLYNLQKKKIIIKITIDFRKYAIFIQTYDFFYL